MLNPSHVLWPEDLFSLDVEGLQSVVTKPRCFFTAWRFVSCCSEVSSELGFDLKASSCLDAREFVVCLHSGCGFKEFGPDNSGNSVNNQ